MANKAFVTGFPIKHSRSPLIHGFWLKEQGIEGSYEAIEVLPENFAEFAASLAKKALPAAMSRSRIRKWLSQPLTAAMRLRRQLAR